MSYLKKLIILFCCALMAQQTIAMQKKQFGKVFKNYINKNTKKRFNGLKQKSPFKLTKSSCSSMRLNCAYWKKIAAANALAAGYSIWSWNNDTLSAESTIPKKSLNALFSDILTSIRQGFTIHSLSSLYNNCDENDKDNLILAIASALKKGYAVEKLDSIYKDSNQKQRTLLLEGLTAAARKGAYCDGLESIYADSDQKQQKMLQSFYLRLFCTTLGIDNNILSKTQSGGHIIDNIIALYSLSSDKSDLNSNSQIFIHKITNNPLSVDVIKRALESEQDYKDKNKFIFYHAQAWNIYWLEFLYTELWKIKHRASIGTYVFTRFPQDDVCSKNAQSIQKQKELHKQLMKSGQGRFDDSVGIFNKSYPFLFLNYALFCYTKDLGSCSIHYFVQNSSLNKPNISTIDIFRRFGLESFYTENKIYIDKIEREFSLLSEHGNLMQLIIPEEHLKKHIYPSTESARKIKVRITKDVFNYTYNDDKDIVEAIEHRVAETDNVVEILETLKTTPHCIQNSNEQQFVWIVTDDTVQKAISDGVEIKSFNSADPETFKKVSNKLTNLLTTKLAGHWAQPELTPWECYKKYKPTF